MSKVWHATDNQGSNPAFTPEAGRILEGAEDITGVGRIVRGPGTAAIACPAQLLLDPDEVLRLYHSDEVLGYAKLTLTCGYSVEYRTNDECEWWHWTINRFVLGRSLRLKLLQGMSLQQMWAPRYLVIGGKTPQSYEPEFTLLELELAEAIHLPERYTQEQFFQVVRGKST